MVEARKLHDRYRLDRLVAAGGMGSVFEATDERLSRRVAVKLLKDELANDPRFVERFRREARAVAALSHPNIASIFDYGEDESGQFIVMEFVDGDDLARVVGEEGPLPVDRVLGIAVQIADALGHAHSAGIVHRDVKPGNVILGDGDRVKVTDFGIAKAGGDVTLTGTGYMLGTARYLSPEQASGGEIGPPTDVYAAGIVVFEMLTGTVPFTGDSPIGVAMRHVSEEPPAPSDLNPAVPAALDAVVARATAKDPAERFRDGHELRAALAAATGAAAGVVATPQGSSGTRSNAPSVGVVGPSGTVVDEASTVWPIPGDRWDPRKVGRTVLIVFGLLALVALVLLGLNILSPDPRPASESGAGRGANPEQSQPAPEVSPSESATGIPLASVIGLNAAEVAEALEELGFTVEQEVVESDEAEGVIVDQDPDAQTNVTAGEDTITLFVSSGPDEEGPKGKAKGHDKEKDEEDD